jgi:hypothetical protein
MKRTRNLYVGVTIFSVMAVLVALQFALQPSRGGAKRRRAGGHLSGRRDVAETASQQLGTRFDRRTCG